VGAFFHKFLIAPSGETADQIKKVGGAKMARTSSITVPSTEGVVGRARAVWRTCVMFSYLSLCLFVCLSRFWMTKFVITETPRSSITFKTIMVSLHRGLFLVVLVHLYWSIYGSPWFFYRGKCIPKWPFLANSGAVSPHFWNHNNKIWRKDADLEPTSVALLVASQYALPGYGDRRVWVRGPGWPDHCVSL